MARRGFTRLPGQTPGEFANHIASQKPTWADPVRQLTAIYYRIRFGETQLEADIRKILSDQLQLLRRG